MWFIGCQLRHVVEVLLGSGLCWFSAVVDHDGVTGFVVVDRDHYLVARGENGISGQSSGKLTYRFGIVHGKRLLL